MLSRLTHATINSNAARLQQHLCMLHQLDAVLIYAVNLPFSKWLFLWPWVYARHPWGPYSEQWCIRLVATG